MERLYRTKRNRKREKYKDRATNARATDKISRGLHGAIELCLLARYCLHVFAAGVVSVDDQGEFILQEGGGRQVRSGQSHVDEREGTGIMAACPPSSEFGQTFSENKKGGWEYARRVTK
jgi:hypothetical protein